MFDFIWSLTSGLALTIVLIALIAALVVGYVPLLKYVPVIGPYVPVARLAAFFLFGLLCALVDRRSSDARDEIVQLKRDLAFSQTQLENQKAVAEDRARLASLSADAAAAAQIRADQYEQRVAQKPIGACALDDDDIRSLQNIRPRRAVKPVGANPARLRGFGARG